MLTMSCLSQKPENCVAMDMYLGYEPWKHIQYLWCKNVDVTMSSENSQGCLWIPCEFYSSLTNQIMCNKESALEFFFWL